MKHSFVAAVAALLLVGGSTVAGAQSRTFKVVGERLQSRNLATVESESDFETFTGKTTKVTGSIDFDPAKKTGKGTILVDVASLNTGIERRDEHLRAEGWMDAAKYPTIKFETTNVKHVNGDNYRVTGNLTIKGVTRKVTTNAKVQYRANGPASKQAGFEGDVIKVSTKFNIKLSDYGVKVPENLAGKVAQNVTLSLSAYALSS